MKYQSKKCEILYRNNDRQIQREREYSIELNTSGLQRSHRHRQGTRQVARPFRHRRRDLRRHRGSHGKFQVRNAKGGVIHAT